MLLGYAQQLASHGLFNVMVQAEGDTWIDDHHTNEDIGARSRLHCGPEPEGPQLCMRTLHAPPSKSRTAVVAACMGAACGKCRAQLDPT